MAGAIGGVLLGVTFLITILLGNLFEVSTLSIGLYLLPGALILSCFALVCGKLSDIFGVRIVLITSSAILIGVLAIFTLTGIGWAPWAIAVIYIFIAACYGAAAPNLPNTAARYLPPEHLATGIGIFNFAFYFGGPVAIALMTIILDRRDGAASALIPSYSGPAAAHADSLLVLLAMGIVALFLALRYAPKQRL